MLKDQHKHQLTDEQCQEIVHLYNITLPDGTWMGSVAIAKIYDVGPDRIIRILRKAGVRICTQGERRRKLTDEQHREIVRLYDTKLPNGTWMSSKAIANAFNVSTGCVLRILKRSGTQIRSCTEAHTGMTCKPIKNLPQGEPPFCKCGCNQTVEWDQHKNDWEVYYPGHYRKDAPYKHRQWLEVEYTAKCRTVEELAAECNVCTSTVLKSMRKLGIHIRPHSETLTTRGSVAGPNNPAWNGGTTPERQRLYKQGHWREFSQSIYARDNFRCCRCGTPKIGHKELHAHHLRNWSQYSALRLDPANIVTLCDHCHRWVHSPANVNHEFLL